MSGVRSGRIAGRWLLGIGLLGTVLSVGCKSFLDPYPPPQVISETNFDPSLGIDLSKMTVTSSGLYYQDIVVGDSTEVGPADTVSIDYTAWLSDGTQVQTGSDVALPLGLGAVIPGLDEGLIGMKVGGERKLIIPSDLAYGDIGNGVVPGGAIVVFDVIVKKVGEVTLGTGTTG